MNRRDFIAHGAGLGAAAAFAPAQRSASYAADMRDMLLAYLTGKLNALAERWDVERARIKTPADIETRNTYVREKFREMVHGFPERCPLAPVAGRTLARRGYRVENVMFQSRPNFWVTGNLYIPDGGAGPFPGIISPCGHYQLARMQPDYQYAYLNLVHAGFVVLAYDPVGQGERRHYWNPQTGETESDLDAVFEHSMPGQLLLMMGEDLTHYRIWDGMRAIDYLETRPEVDKERIGCAGHSGGGTLTQFISSLDERVKCAVVNQGGTSHRWPIALRPENRVGPSDVEQNLFPAAALGVDLCDIHVAIAPRPLLSLIEDFNPQFNRAAEHIRERYRQLGVPEKFATVEATDPHAWTVKLRLAATDWFCRWFYNRPGPEREPEFEAEALQSLYSTPNGSVRYSQQGETIFSLILRKQAKLPPLAPPPRAGEFDAFRSRVRDQIRKILHLKTHTGSLEVRHIVTTPRKGYSIEKVEFLSEPGIYIPAWVFVPEKVEPTGKATLFVHEGGKEAEGMEFGRLEGAARKGLRVIAVDVRGIGATRPPHSPSIAETHAFHQLFDVEAAMTYMTWFMDESLFGMRVFDVLRSVEYLLSRPDFARPGVRVVGKGAGALWALYAAALDDRIQDVVCEDCLLSYRTLAVSDRYTHATGIFIRDVLLNFDLPQVAAAVGRPLAFVSPVDAMKRPVDLADARRAYEWTAETYRNSGAEGSFRISTRGEESLL